MQTEKSHPVVHRHIQVDRQLGRTKQTTFAFADINRADPSSSFTNAD
jgi:hypothetical protein